MDLRSNESQNLISIQNNRVDTKSLVKWNDNLIDISTVKYDIFSAKIETKANGTLLRLGAKRTLREPTSSIKDNTLYLFFSNISVDNSLASTLKPNGFIRGMQIKYVNGNPQMEIKLKEGYDSYEVFYDEEIGEVLVSIHNKFLKTEKYQLIKNLIKCILKDLYYIKWLKCMNKRLINKYKSARL